MDKQTKIDSLLGKKKLTLSQTSPGFYVSTEQVFLKKLWEKEKLLVTSNFSFSHGVFYPFGDLSAIFVKFEIVDCKLFAFGRVQNLSFGKEFRAHLLARIGSFFHILVVIISKKNHIL